MPPKKTSSRSAQSEEQATDDQSAPSAYLTKAAELGAEVRAFVEETREALDGLLKQHRELGEESPGPEDFAAATAARYVPMSAGDLNRALDTLLAAAMDLQQKAAR